MSRRRRTVPAGPVAHARPGRAESRARARLGNPRRRNPRLEHLETRVVPTITGFQVDAFPKLIAPSGRYESVLVTGSVKVDQNPKPRVNFQLVDEYRLHQPARGVQPQLIPGSNNEYSFRFRLRVPAQIDSSDGDGRLFTLTVAANQNGTSTGQTLPILIANVRPPRASGLYTPSAQRAMAQARQEARLSAQPQRTPMPRPISFTPPPPASTG